MPAAAPSKALPRVDLRDHPSTTPAIAPKPGHPTGRGEPLRPIDRVTDVERPPCPRPIAILA